MSMRATTATARHVAKDAEGAATPTATVTPAAPASATPSRGTSRNAFRQWMIVALLALVVAVLGLTFLVHARSLSVSSKSVKRIRIKKEKPGRRVVDAGADDVRGRAPPLPAFGFDADGARGRFGVRGGGGGDSPGGAAAVGGLDVFAAKDILAASQSVDASLAVAGPAAAGGFGGDTGVGQLLGDADLLPDGGGGGGGGGRQQGAGARQQQTAAEDEQGQQQAPGTGGEGGGGGGSSVAVVDALAPVGLLPGLPPLPVWATAAGPHGGGSIAYSAAGAAGGSLLLPWVRPGRAMLESLSSGAVPLGGVGRGAGASIAGGGFTLAARFKAAAAAASTVSSARRRGGGAGAAAPLPPAQLPPSVNLLYPGGQAPELSRDTDIGELIKHSLRSLTTLLPGGQADDDVGGAGDRDSSAAGGGSRWLDRFGMGNPLSGSAYAGAAVAAGGGDSRQQLGSFADVSGLTKGRLRRQRRCKPRQQRAETAWQAPGLAATVDGKSPYRQLHVFFAWIGMQHDGQLGRLRRVLCDVIEHTDADVTVHLVTDHAVARDPGAFPITRVAPTCEGCHYRYYSWGQFMLAQESEGYRRLCEAFNAANQSPTKNSLATCIYLLKPFLHLIVDPAVPSLVALDGDLRIAGDLLDLLDETLPEMRRKGSVVGLAPEMQPEYELLGYGPLAWNGGMQLLDLQTMRASERYARLLATFAWETYPPKWRLASELGDQTLYTVLAVRQEPTLVHTLGCEWNRQLCSYYGDRVRECLPDVPRTTRVRWEQLFQCPRPTRVLHGNCLSLRRGSNELEGTTEEWLPRQEERERRIVHESFLVLSGRLPALFPRGTNGRTVGGPGSLERECKTVWLWSKETAPPASEAQRLAMQKYAGLRKAMVDRELAAALAV